MFALSYVLHDLCVLSFSPQTWTESRKHCASPSEHASSNKNTDLNSDRKCRTPNATPIAHSSSPHFPMFILQPLCFIQCIQKSHNQPAHHALIRNLARDPIQGARLAPLLLCDTSFLSPLDRLILLCFDYTHEILNQHVNRLHHRRRDRDMDS